jgi:hypothetical protein
VKSVFGSENVLELQHSQTSNIIAASPDGFSIFGKKNTENKEQKADVTSYENVTSFTHGVHPCDDVVGFARHVEQFGASQRYNNRGKYSFRYSIKCS